MSREGKLIKSTLLLSIGTFLPKFAAFFTLPILTGLLTKEEYGTYDLITVLVTLYLPAITLQVQTAAFRFLIDQRGNDEKTTSTITNIFAFVLPSSLLGLLIIWLFLPDNIFIKALICSYFFFDILLSTLRQIARGLNKNIEYSISAAIASIGSIVFVFALVYVGKLGLIGAVLTLSISSLLSFVTLAYRINILQYIDIRSIDLQRVKSLVLYSWPMVPNSMSMWVMRLSDRLVVTAVMGVAYNAVYGVANKIPSLLNIAQGAFTLAWQENASVVSKDDDAEQYYSSMFYTLFNLMAGFLGLLICLTPILFVLLIRGDYFEAYNQMPILFLATFFYSMATFLGGIYVAYMKTKNVGITTAIAALLNLLVDIALIKQIGLYAASGSTLISYFVLLVYRMLDVQRIVRIKYDFMNIILVVMILITECVLCFMRLTVTNVINIVIGISCFCFLNRSFLGIVFRKISQK